MSHFDFEAETTNEVVQVESPTAQKIVAKERELAETEASIADRLADKKRLEDEIKSIREAMQAQIDEKQQAIREIDVELWDTRSKIRSLKMEIDALRRALTLELENARKTEEYKSNALEFSKRIANFHYIDRILPHQKEGAFVLATSGRAILGDKRGLGKTLTSIATLDALQVQKVLIVVPDDVLSNFVNEIAYWAPHRTVFPVGKMPKAQREFAFSMAKMLDQWIMVVNYSAWRKDKGMLDTFISLGIECVIADEAHEMKNTSTSAFKGVKKVVMAENVCPMCNSMDITKDVRHSEQFRTVYYDKCNKCDWQSNSTVHEWDFMDRKSVKYVFPMTGTVILNKPQDLFANLHLVDPVVFADEATYLRMYCEQDWATGKWKFQSGGLDRLTRKLGGKYLARDEKSAGVIRPKQSVYVHEIDFDREMYPLQWKVIEQLSKHAQIILDNGEQMSVLAQIALITRKRQANVWPAGIQLKNEKGDVVFSVGDEVRESIKLDKIIKYDVTGELQGLIPEFTEDGDKELGSRVVVFSQFKGPLAELERRLKTAGISVVRFDGDTPDDIRNQAKLDFDRKFCEQPDYNEGNGYKWQVILCNYKTGGVGLNFTAATEMIVLDEEWNPGKADQAFGRIDRMGQTEETNVHILRIANSIDSWMVKLNEQKKEIIDGFESSASNVASDLLTAMKNGDII
jgi:SNF2 family DNA or RNA helicase